jgi:hypothetical protein
MARLPMPHCRRRGRVLFYSVFERSLSSGLTRGWVPVRLKKTRQNKKLEPGLDLIKTGMALERDEAKCAAVSAHIPL